ncbi:MAG: hypothetical protein Q7J48_04145 [Nocardioides sp.]|nr:hypothetical protein [Nocardioides sp.]
MSVLAAVRPVPAPTPATGRARAALRGSLAVALLLGLLVAIVVASLMWGARDISAEAATLLEEIDGRVAAAAAAHPEFEGKTIAAVAIDPSAFYVYRGADPRVQFLEDLGFALAPSVDELDTEEASFYYTPSTEEVDKLTSDVLLSYVPTEDRVTEIAEDPAMQAMSQFQEDRVATVVGEAVVSSMSPPTALSLTWGLEAFVEALVPAVDAAG